MNNTTLGERIAYLLKVNKMTQKTLAAKIGITPVTLSRYVRDERIPKGLALSKMADALNTTTDFILGNSPDDEVSAREKEEAQRAALESDYYTIHRLISRNAPFMTKRQRNELIIALLEQTP